MFRQFEFVSWIAGGIARSVSNPAVGHASEWHWADKFQEFVLRLRRAGLLFFAQIAGLLVLSLAVHPIGLLLWLIAFPLAGFGALLSMLWPTRRLLKRRSQNSVSVTDPRSPLIWLVRRRGEIPPASRPAFDLVIERAKRSETLGGAADDLLAKEAQRLVRQHLPRLIQSFLALPSSERTAGQVGELTEGLAAIAEELADLNERLLASRTDRFEIERRFIANRYPPRDGLAGV